MFYFLILKMSVYKLSWYCGDVFSAPELKLCILHLCKTQPFFSTRKLSKLGDFLIHILDAFGFILLASTWLTNLG